MFRFPLGNLFDLLYDGYKELQLRFYYVPVFHRFLYRRHSYYTALPLSQKLRFLRVARDNFEHFEFVPRGMEVTDTMKAIISSAAAQLTINLPSDSLSYYKRIIIYPEYYHSRITRKQHKGEVNPGLRIIVFSWRGVVEGLDRKEHGLNLLLHEFAHALWLEHKLMHRSYRVLDETQVRLFEQYAEDEMKNVVDNERHFFRKYAFENVEEFFAVAVENFFERPGQFHKKLPDLYLVLEKLFNQNPAKVDILIQDKSLANLN